MKYYLRLLLFKCNKIYLSFIHNCYYDHNKNYYILNIGDIFCLYGVTLVRHWHRRTRYRGTRYCSGIAILPHCRHESPACRIIPAPVISLYTAHLSVPHKRHGTKRLIRFWGVAVADGHKLRRALHT